MPRLKLLKYKKSRKTLASYKVHHNSVFSYIKGARSKITESDPRLKYYVKPHNIECIKMLGLREPSISGLCGLNDVDDLYTESCKQRECITTPMSSLYKYRSMRVHH